MTRYNVQDPITGLYFSDYHKAYVGEEPEWFSAEEAEDIALTFRGGRINAHEFGRGDLDG